MKEPYFQCVALRYGRVSGEKQTFSAQFHIENPKNITVLPNGAIHFPQRLGSQRNANESVIGAIIQAMTPRCSHLSGKKQPLLANYF